MANMVYADPFGSYVRGQQAGAETAIGVGKAAREFRDSDRQADFMKWYRPLREREAAAEAARAEAITGQQQLGLNEGLTQNAARLTALGPEGREYFQRQIARTYGIPEQSIAAANPDDFMRIAGAASGAVPYGAYDPTFAYAGHMGYQKLFGSPEATNPATVPGIQYNTPWSNPTAPPSSSGGVQASPTPSFANVQGGSSTTPAMQQDFSVHPWK